MDALSNPGRQQESGDGWYFTGSVTATDIDPALESGEIYFTLEEAAALYDAAQGTFASGRLEVDGVPAGKDRTLSVTFEEVSGLIPIRELSGSTAGISTLIGQTANVTVELLEPCGLATASGGEGVTVNEHNLGQPSGTFNFAWDAFGVPDQFEVLYEDTTLLNTGVISGAGSQDLTYSGESTKVTVRVTGSEAGTAWDYTLSCPQ